MSRKGGSFFEEHIEKVVLLVVGLLCVWLLVTRVLFSPNKVIYGREKLSPGEIDYRIREQAELLENKLNRKPEPKPLPEEKCGEFIATMNSSIQGIDISLFWPLPICSSLDFSDNRKYRIPRLGEISEASVEHIRAVAYLPTREIDKESIYDKDNSEPNDIDFVTVQSEIDVGRLVKNFYGSFAGESVRQEWRDPCLANPVFAAVQLERQELLADGSWGDWQTVSRTKIDHRKKMFEIIEDVEKLPSGGIQVRLLQFDDMQVMIDLLQPEAYRIASAEEEWFPPSLHKRYVKYLKEVEAQEKREALEAKRKKREQERERRREERLGPRAGTMSSPGRITRTRTYDESRDRTGLSSSSMLGRLMRPRGIRGDRGLGSPGRGGRPLMDRTREGFAAKKKSPEKGKKVSKTKSMSDFYDEYNKLLITEETDIAKMRKPLVFWAHDDTVGPGRSYRYRIRLGVFNPIAGTDYISERDRAQKNGVVLWSEFSDKTEIVKIPASLYFFPHKIQEAAIVTVKVCRYVFGYWYSKNFRVKQGEVIGKVVEPKTAEGDEEERELVKVTIPKTIDYSTGAIYVDAIPVDNWGGGKNMYRRPYYDMLYSFDGTQIEHIPINRSYWAQELQNKFSEIEELEEKPKKALRDWGTRSVRYKRRTPKMREERTERTEKTERKKGRRGEAEMDAWRKMMERRRGGR